MPSQIRWDEHVMNPSLFSVWSVNAQLANCISLRERKKKEKRKKREERKKNDIRLDQQSIR